MQLSCRMSVESEDQISLLNASGNDDAVLKNAKLSYTREFLVSLSNLDICRKLPSGFDESLLSEFEDTSQIIPDRPRIPGSLPLQGFRRNQYGSSPPTQGDSGNYSRVVHGKWESRSSGRSDRDSDSQSDRDSDSGKRFGPQPRGSWQTREHDGLLGSGSFPRPLGNAVGMSAPKLRTNEHYQLSKTSEPYHPPRPYKAVPHSRRDTDSYNDETFGSVECTSEDRVEEERKRRVSFEMMRKEQQKVLQEKQKPNLEKQKDDVSDFSEVDDSKEERELLARKNESEVSGAIPNISNNLEKSSFASHSPASRPLVPPGFRNNALEKNCGVKSLIHPPSAEVWRPATEVGLSDSEANLVQKIIEDGLERKLSQEILVDGQSAEKIQHLQFLNKDENVNLLPDFDGTAPKLGMEDQLSNTSSHFNFHETLDDFGMIELGAKVPEDTVNDSTQICSTSILENFFGSKVSMNESGSTSIEHRDRKPDDTRRPNSVQSSKFAQWFFEEEIKPVDMSSGRPNDLLSLIVSGDKGRCQVTDSESAERFSSDLSFKTLEQSDQLDLGMPSSSGIADQQSINVNEESIPAVLTCEDLEQSILSAYSAKNTAAEPVSESWSASSANTEQQNAHVDGHASVHLLSLLQKGAERTINSDFDSSLLDEIPGSPEYNMESTVNKPKWVENNSNTSSSVNTLTLETLFGTAFMKELQSVEAPVSIQRGSLGSAQVDSSESPGLPLPVSDNGLPSPRNHEFGLQRTSHDYNVLPSNHKHQSNLSKVESWNGVDGSQIDITLSKHYKEESPKLIGFQEGAETQLPELRSISSSDPRDHWMSKFMSIGSSSNNANSSLDGNIDIMDKLTAINSVKDQQLMVDPESRHLLRDPYEQLEPHVPYQSLQMHQSLPPPFRTPQVSQVRPLYHRLESNPAHTSSYMKLLGAEPMFNHDSLVHHQIPSNINRSSFPHQNSRVAGLESRLQHSVLHQQMQMSGNHLPHMLPDFSRGGPVPRHGDQAPHFLQDVNQMQNFPIGPRTPNIGSRGMPIPDISAGSHPSEAFQRLIEMERRANAKQFHPFGPFQSRGIHGHEPDLGFQYR